MCSEMKLTFFYRYLSSKLLPVWTILLIDVVIIALSGLLSYALRYDFRSIFLQSSTISETVVWEVLVNLLFFRVFRTYSNVLRFSSFVDIMRIFVSLTVSYLLLIVVSVLFGNYLGIRIAPVSVLLMSYVISFALMSCSRVVVKIMFDDSILSEPDEIIEKKYKDIPNNVDIICSHSAPICFSPVVVRLPGEMDDKTYNDILDERRYLDYIFLNIRCKYWYYGHFHKSITSSIDGVVYKCLDTMEIYQLINIKEDN